MKEECSVNSGCNHEEADALSQGSIECGAGGKDGASHSEVPISESDHDQFHIESFDDANHVANLAETDDESGDEGEPGDDISRCESLDEASNNQQDDRQDSSSVASGEANTDDQSDYQDIWTTALAMGAKAMITSTTKTRMRMR